MKLTLTRYMTCTGYAELEINQKLCDYVNEELRDYYTSAGWYVEVSVNQIEALYSSKLSEEDENFFDQDIFYKDRPFAYCLEEVVDEIVKDALYTADYDIVDGDTQDCYIEVEN